MIEYLPQALSSLQAALTLGKSLIDIKDTSEAQAALIKFNEAIINAQQKIIASQSDQSSMLAQIDELKKECVRFQNWEAEKNTYTRKEIATGIFAYISNDYVGDLKSAHKYCCNCFDSHEKSTLQQFNVNVGRQLGLSCHKKCPDLIFRHYIDVT